MEPTDGPFRTGDLSVLIGWAAPGNRTCLEVMAVPGSRDRWVGLEQKAISKVKAVEINRKENCRWGKEIVRSPLTALLFPKQ